ncbi:hypothetical protein WN943_002831 [Citrus x changshan-huyou]
MYASLWNADDWATRGGLAKTDWSQAPFTASFGNFNAKACVLSIGISSCSSNPTTKNTWFSQELDSSSQRKLKWVQQNYMSSNGPPFLDLILFTSTTMTNRPSVKCLKEFDAGLSPKDCGGGIGRSKSTT